MRTDDTITRKQAIEIAGQKRKTEWYHFDDDFYTGICWKAPPGVLQFLNFDEMTGDELHTLSLQIRYGNNDK